MSNTEDEIFVKVSSQIIIDILRESAHGLRNWVKKNNDEIDPLGIAARKYSKHLIQYLNVIRVFGMDKPNTLDNLYVDAYLYDKTIENTVYSHQELRDSFNSEKRIIDSSRKRLGMQEIVNSYLKILILGNPGSGKTTFLRNLALLNLKKDSILSKRRMPVFISIREFSQKQVNLDDFIIEQFNLHLNDNSEKLVRRLLLNGKCQILLDGLDEISSSRHSFVFNQIKELSTKYKDNQVVISCRIGAYYNWFQHFTNLEIAEFDDRQINLFAEKWFDNKVIIEDFIEKLNANIPVKELASNPLLLTLICIAYDEKKLFPENKAKLYDTSIEILVDKWDKSKQLIRDGLDENLSSNDIIKIICDVGYGTFKRDEFFIPKRTLASYVTNSILNVKSKDFDLIGGEDFINMIEVHQGLFAKRSSDVYSFSHLTFQEYFAAKNIVIQNDSQSLIQIIEEIIFKTRWREVIAIVAGLMPIGDEFIDFLKSKMDSIIERDKKIKRLIQYSRATIQLNDPNLIERVIPIYIFLKIISKKTTSYNSGLEQIKFLIRNLQYSHNLSIPEIFNQIHYSIFKRPLDDYEKLIVSIRDELDLPGDIIHKMLYPFNFEELMPKAEEFIMFRHADDKDFDKRLSDYFYLVSIYYDCLASDPYLKKFNVIELRNQILDLQ
jgi:hypothetical protein